MSERETSVQEEFAKLGLVTFANPILEKDEEIDNTQLEENIATLSEYCCHQETIIRGKMGAFGITAGFINEYVFAIQIDDGKDVVLIYNREGDSIYISTGDRKRGYYSKEHIGRLCEEDAKLFKDAVDVLNNEII